MARDKDYLRCFFAMSELRDYIHNLMLVTSGKAREYNEARYNASRDVKVSRCADVLTKEQIAHIRGVLRPQMHECYRNALLVAIYLDCLFVDGQMQCVVGIDHAFNKVCDKYIDVTQEFALGEDPTETDYIAYGEYDGDTAASVMQEEGVYTSVFDSLWTKTNKI